MKKRFKLISVLSAVFFTLLIANHLYQSQQHKLLPTQTEGGVIQAEHVPAQKLFGIPVDSFEVETKVVQRGESFGNILMAYGIDYPIINKIATEFKDIFDVRKLRMGKPYSVFCEGNDSLRVARYLVYESSAVDYYVFDLKDSVQVYQGKKEVTVKQREVSGIIQSSLYEALIDRGASAGLIMRLSDIYAWSIDFFHLRKGDYFKLVYEEKFIDDTVSVGTGRILAADFNHGGQSFYSFYFKKDDYSDYFNEEGNTLRKAFLKAPLDFSRISSRYSPKRFHPVLKRWKSHLGTDYAAPHGTPIKATSDGTVIAATYTSGNGNYVKIRHNSTYTTQYLHMSKFAKGMHKGKVVRQGDVIGYVGSTGLATGPHVCYRFWKNGVQVDPYKQDLPEAEPIKPEYKDEYTSFMEKWKSHLDTMPIQEVPAPEDDVLMASAGK